MPDLKPHLCKTAALAALCAGPVFADLTEFPVSCGDLFTGANEGTDCMIYHGDEENRAVVFDYSEDGTQLSVLQITDDGTIEQQSEPFEIGDPGSFPIMKDLNGDGVMEIMFAAGSHADDYGYEIWTQGDDDPLFAPMSSAVLPLYDLEDLKVSGNIMVYMERYATEQIIINGIYLDGPNVWDVYRKEIFPDGTKSTCEVTVGEAGRELGYEEDSLKSECEALAWN